VSRDDNPGAVPESIARAAEQRLRGALLGTQADSLADGVLPGDIEPVLGITR